MQNKALSACEKCLQCESVSAWRAAVSFLSNVMPSFDHHTCVACAANFATSPLTEFNQAYATPTNAIFNILGLSGLPTIAPVANELVTVTLFDLYSLWMAPIYADTMTVTFTPFTGVNVVAAVTNVGAGTPYEITLTRGTQPTLVTFPAGDFRGISAVRINVVSTTGQVRQLSLRAVVD